MTKKPDAPKDDLKLWAIETNYTDIDGTFIPGYIGIHWWFKKEPGCSKPEWLYGTALFRNKAEALRHLPDVRASYPAARVVRVTEEVKVFAAIRQQARRKKK